MTITKLLGYLNFSRAIENSIRKAQRDYFRKILNAQTSLYQENDLVCPESYGVNMRSDVGFITVL